VSDRTDDLIISVSTDVSTIKRQLKQLGDVVGQTASGIQKQFDGLGKGIDQSMTPIQKRINAMVGLPVGPKLKEWQGALANVEGASKLTANQMLNLSRQGNDVATMFALGAPAMQIFASQAGQVYGALQEGPGGVAGSLKALGAQAIGLATKFPLATAAIAAAGVAFVAYEALGGSSLRTLDEILKHHEENIKRLGDAYDEVNGKRQNYAQISAATANLVNDKDVADAKANLQRAIDEILSSVTFQSGVGRGGGVREFVKSQFAPFSEAINDLKASAKDTSALRAFTDAVTAIAQTNPNLKEPAQDLIAFAKNALDAAGAVQAIDGVIPDAIDNVSAFDRALANVDSKPIQKELQDLFDKAREGKEPIDGILQSLAALEQSNPNFAGIIAGFKSILIAASQTEAALDNLGSKYFANQGTNPNGRQRLPVGVLPDTVDVVPEHANKEDLGAAYDKAVAKAAKANKFHAPKKTFDDQFANDLQSIRDRTAALNEEMASLGLSYEAQTKRKTALDLEQQALKQVREEARKKGDTDWQNAQLTPEQIAQIDAVSEAYARQAEELRKAQEAQQLQRDILQGAFGDLRSALDDGKLDWQDFANIAINALDKVIDKIENDLIDAIMQANGAGGGALGSILGFLTGGGGGGSSNIFPGGGVLNSLGGLYDTGGYTGSGGKKQVAGLVHKGEVVFSQDDVQRLGGVSAVEAMRKGKVIGTPQMPAIAAAGGSQTFAPSVTFAPVIQLQGGGDDAGRQVTAALKKFDREFTPRVVKSLHEAKMLGML
jgi:hypothetical protein